MKKRRLAISSESKFEIRKNLKTKRTANNKQSRRFSSLSRLKYA